MNDETIIRVVFLGAPSTGKTSLCKALAEKYKTVWMPEYGREYWIEHQRNRRLSPQQLVEIAEGHIEREDRLLPAANRFLFVDTEAIVTYHFALDYHGKALPRLEALADASGQRYDIFFICEPDIPYDDTWERSGAQHRARFQEQIRADLVRRGIRFVSLRGTLQERVAQVVAVLEK